MEMIRMIKCKSRLGSTITKLVVINTARPLMLATVMLFATGCSICDNSLKSEAISPDRGLIARTCERNCGATTDFSSIVNLQSTSVKYDSNDGVLFIAKGQYDISTKWTGPKSLLITCNGCSRANVFREVSVLGDIDVSYAVGPK